MNNQALKELTERLRNYDSCHGARLTDLSDLFINYFNDVLLPPHFL